MQINKYFNQLKKEIYSNKLNYVLLTLLLLFAFFLRVYRVDKILGFFYDQGRDALIIWDLWHKGDVFLVGPTTGIAGILRGPFYYYLIAPIYLIGGGSPIWPAVFLAFLSVLALLVMYYLAAKIESRLAGLVAVFIAAVSLNIVNASRWLSNPTPMLLLSMLLVWAIFLIIDGKKWPWILASFIAGLSLSSFGSAGEVFYFLALFIIFIWQYRKDNRPSLKIILLSALALFLTAFPQILFDIVHGGILRQNIAKFLVEDESFKVSFWEVLDTRLNYFYDVFTNKIFHQRDDREMVLLLGVLFFFVANIKHFWNSKYFKALVILLISPMIGMFFFQGNYGNIYDYYMTGYYLIFILTFSIVMAQMRSSAAGRSFIAIFLLIVLVNNGYILWFKLRDGVDGPYSVALKNQLQALDWVYEDAQGQPFSVDTYVPPVIPYAYEYLYLWYGGEVKGYTPSDEMIDPLYTLYEVDPPHPERLQAWLDRQIGIGKVEQEVRYGGIVVQRRARLPQEDDENN